MRENVIGSLLFFSKADAFSFFLISSRTILAVADYSLYAAPSLCTALLIAISRGLAPSAISLFSVASSFHISYPDTVFPPPISLFSLILPRSRDNDKGSPVKGTKLQNRFARKFKKVKTHIFVHF